MNLYKTPPPSEIKITSLDNYFTGKEENHVPGATYYRGHTWEADTIFEKLTEEEFKLALPSSLKKTVNVDLIDKI